MKNTPIKYFILVISMLFLNLVSFAQGVFDEGLEMSVFGGVAIPLGDFAAKELSDWNEHCGCAKTAGSFAIKFKGRLSGDFFGVFSIQGARNVYDPKPITKALRKQFESPFSTETDSWKTTAFMVGGGYSFSLGDKLNFFVEATGVMNNLDTYFFRIQSPDGANRYPLLQKSVEDIGFGYALGSDLTYDIFDGMGLGLSVNYMKTFHTIEGADRRYNGGDLIPQNYKQNVEMLLVQISVFIRAW